MKLIVTVLVFIFSSAASAHTFNPCTGKKGEQCEINLMQLKPTQINVGDYEVSVDKLPNLIDQVKTCFDKSNLKACFDENLKPYLTQDDELLTVIFGYHNQYYIVDGHHHAYALWLLYHNSGLCDDLSTCDIPVYVNTIHNYANDDFPLAEFWQKMTDQNYFWPWTYDATAKQYIPFSYADLPTGVSKMGDDPYRSVFGLARKWGDFKKPTGNQLNFYQFKWAACLLQYFNFSSINTNPDYNKLILDARLALKNNASDMMAICTSKEFENMPEPELG